MWPTTGATTPCAARRRPARRLRDPRHPHHARPRQKAWRLPWGQEVPLAPFFGSWPRRRRRPGACSTAPPRRNGGNLDNKELGAGATLYLPIFVDDALFSVGDGHGVQGDGEVCITAVETGLTGTFRLTVRDDMRLEWPMAETPTHVITMAFDPDLDDCVVIALRQMLDLICAAPGSTATRPHLVQSRGRSAGDAGRQRQQGHPRDARQALSHARAVACRQYGVASLRPPARPGSEAARRRATRRWNRRRPACR